jgi:hypothetical protein
MNALRPKYRSVERSRWFGQANIDRWKLCDLPAFAILFRE